MLIIGYVELSDKYRTMSFCENRVAAIAIAYSASG